MILVIIVAVGLGCLSLGFSIGGLAERFYFNPKEEAAMSKESDALKISLDAGAAGAEALGVIITGLQTKATAVNAQLTEGAAVVVERDALKVENADLNTTIATLQAEADTINAKNQANADALAGIAGSLPPAA